MLTGEWSQVLESVFVRSRGPGFSVGLLVGGATSRHYWLWGLWCSKAHIDLLVSGAGSQDSGCRAPEGSSTGTGLLVDGLCPKNYRLQGCGGPGGVVHHWLAGLRPTGSSSSASSLVGRAGSQVSLVAELWGF